MNAEKTSTHSSKMIHSAKNSVKDLNISLNPFGEVVSSLRIDKINQFLDKNLEDKKLGNKVDRD